MQGSAVSQQFYTWWPQNTGSVPHSPHGPETNTVNVHVRENEAGPAPKHLPSAPSTVVLRIPVLGKSGADSGFRCAC